MDGLNDKNNEKNIDMNKQYLDTVQFNEIRDSVPYRATDPTPFRPKAKNINPVISTDNSKQIPKLNQSKVENVEEKKASQKDDKCNIL